jgi:hypothetical protein
MVLDYPQGQSVQIHVALYMQHLKGEDLQHTITTQLQFSKLAKLDELGTSRTQSNPDQFSSQTVLVVFLTREQYESLLLLTDNGVSCTTEVQFVLVAKTISELQKLKSLKQKKSQTLKDNQYLPAMQLAFIPEDNIVLRSALDQKIASYYLQLDEYTKADGLHKLQTLTQVEALALQKTNATLILNLDFLIDENHSKPHQIKLIQSSYEKTVASRLKRLVLIHTLIKKYKLKFAIQSAQNITTPELTKLYMQCVG